MTDTQQLFFAAERERAVRPVNSFADFEKAAREAAILVGRGDIELQEAADRLWDIAASTGLAKRHGGDTIQARLTAAFRSVDIRTKAERNAKATGLIATCLADIAMKQIDWLWPDRIAIGKVTTLAGEGGLGKSTLLFDIAARVSRGDAWPDGDVRNIPGMVLILSSEDDPADTVKPRLQAAGAEMSRIFFLSMRRDESGVERAFDLQADLVRLEKTIGELGGVRLVIIDPITAYLGKTNSNSNAAVRAVLARLGDMAERTRVAVICNTHFAKAGASNANRRIIGSVAFVNQSRMVFIVTPDADQKDRRLLLPSKANITGLKTGLAFRIEQCLVGETAGEAANIVATRIAWESAPISIAADAAIAALRQSENGTTSAKAEAVAFLRELLAEGAKPAGEVIEMAGAMGLGLKPLRAAREQLGIKPMRSGQQYGWSWALPAADL
jgi:putative DNA primase/helicase